MPSPSRPAIERLSPRWHLVNLVPLWIVQVLTFWSISFLAGYITRTQNIASALNFVCFALIAAEVWVFAQRAGRPLSSLVFQTAKIFTVGGLWMATVAQNMRRYNMNLDDWMIVLGWSLLLTVLTLPFSIHFIYAIVEFQRSVVRGRGRAFKKLGGGTGMERMSDGDDNNQVCGGRHENGPRQRLCDEEIQWSLRRNLWPNWILQFTPSLILCFFVFITARGYGSNTTILYVALVVLSFSLMTHLTDATHPEYSAERLTYATGGVLFFLPVYEIYYSFKKDSTKISLRHYLKFQMAKVEILYLLLDLVVWGWGKWELGFMNCVRNFIYVVLLSILLGFPFIAEFVYAVIEHARYRQKVLGLCEESVDEKYDLEAGSAKIFCDVV